jgi:glutathione S-transferase
MCCRNGAGNRKQFYDTMRAVEGALGAEGGPFFLGAELTLVDIVFSPFLERIVASIPYYKGEQLRGSP